MELDHLFLFVSPEGPEAEALIALGLRESFRRAHPGQGTANLCYCFDNAYLELLWLSDEAAARSPGVARTGLAERSGWRENGANPFGLALRGEALPFPAWDYRPAYFPEGLSIPVAAFSDDPAQPFVFLSPGRQPPDQWDDGRAGRRQQAAGLKEIAAVELILPQAVDPAPELEALAREDWLTLRQDGDCAQLILTLTRDAGAPQRLLLPDCRLL
jgi:hypothetical protein